MNGEKSSVGEKLAIFHAVSREDARQVFELAGREVALPLEDIEILIKKIKQVMSKIEFLKPVLSYMQCENSVVFSKNFNVLLENIPTLSIVIRFCWSSGKKLPLDSISEQDIKTSKYSDVEYI